MTRVLLVVKGLNRGGTEQLLLSAAPYLDSHRFEYEVAYLLRSTTAMRRPLEQAGFRLHCLDDESGARWISRLRALVWRRSIDIVHTHSPYPAVGARLAFIGRRRPRFVHTEHGPWNSYHPLTYWANLMTLWRNDHVFAVSNHVLGSMRYPAALRFLPRPPIETLYQGIDFGSPVSPVPDGVRAELAI